MPLITEQLLRELDEPIRKIIRDELDDFIRSDRYTFEKRIQLLDGRNIQVGTTTGSSFGTAITQKASVYGVSPVVQASAITTPNTQGGTYNQTDITTLKTAIDA